MVTLPRQLLFALSLRPGEMVELEWDDKGECKLRPWVNRENVSGRSPGVLADEPPKRM